VDFGAGRIQSQSKQTDIFLAAFSPDSQCLWAKRFGGPYEQQTRSVAVDANGNIALTGVFKGAICVGSLTLTEPYAGDYCGFLAKLDQRGNALWCKRFGDPFVEQGGAVAFDRRNGDILAAGFIRNRLALAARGGAALCLLVRYDPAGVLRWSKTFGPRVFPDSLAVAPDGRILLTGHFEHAVDFGLGALVSAGGNDIFAVVFAPGGEPRWSKSFGDRQQQFLVKGEFGRDGSAVLAGSFHGTIDFGTGPLTARDTTGRRRGPRTCSWRSLRIARERAHRPSAGGSVSLPIIATVPYSIVRQPVGGRAWQPVGGRVSGPTDPVRPLTPSPSPAKRRRGEQKRVGGHSSQGFRPGPRYPARQLTGSMPRTSTTGLSPWAIRRSTDAATDGLTDPCGAAKGGLHGPAIKIGGCAAFLRSVCRTRISRKGIIQPQ